MRHFLDLSSFNKEEILQLINQAIKFKREGYPRDYLRNEIIALLFEKPSTRTRVSFSAAIVRMGGTPIYLPSQELQLVRGEPIKDTARVLARYVSAIVARLRRHEDLIELANYSSVPVINALTDKHHPCQALADVMTMMEYSNGLGFKVSYVGDGNNVCASLVQIASKLGIEISVASPKGYELDSSIVEQALKWASESGATLQFTNDPEEAVRDADFVYTDVFVSMGMESEEEARRKAFLPTFRVTRELMRLAKPGAKFMHCMPMKRGDEVEEEVADGEYSIVIDQAENRMHTAAALLYHLLKERKS